MFSSPTRLWLFTALFAFSSFSLAADRSADRTSVRPFFYSKSGSEVEVQFTAIFHTRQAAADLKIATDDQKQYYTKYEMEPTLAFLFGPLTHTELGSPQKTFDLQVRWDEAVQKEGYSEVPYTYRGRWIMNKIALQNPQFSIPFPFSESAAFSPKWKRCGDSHPDHQTRGYYWYYWDPNRYGCDQIQGVHYQMVQVQIAGYTKQETETYPEYARMIRTVGERKKVALTFAFGYVKDDAQKNPFQDYDAGALEFQDFLQWVRTEGSRLSEGDGNGGLDEIPTAPSRAWKETPITMDQYPGYENRNSQLGILFEKSFGDLDVQIKVVANFKVDQMELFAKSYAKDHDAFFSWFGHSRVGSGFDADNFQRMLKYQPEHYSATNDYQVIYWGGCNSYSYYTLPFFRLKATPADPNGTKNLDIVANGLPSYFHFNSVNARIAMIGFMKGLVPANSTEKGASYQQMIDAVENHAERGGITVLATVLGDEDNARNP